MIVIADTSGTLAAFDTAHPSSDLAYRVLEEAGLTVFSPLVLAELDHVGRRELGEARARDMLEDIVNAAERGDFAIAETGPSILLRAQQVQARYASLSLDLADAVNVALAEEYETDAILTLDRRDFRAVLPLTEHKAFRVLPDDL
ncbi:PIN domain-containing protein [Streptomyces himalayensis]|uniref:Ribonuclease VapC n=1 Tax=Streptomyces himalayensis subsp. himalayensis TaxID=2756131 RepID=A0A7W0DQN4_9ACTN|nr:PIN domain-containing protein [Streptomyces himalayensis]MBA2949482.1 PIN domain-containing protein [Streptomyces himalayensis subsp. himalayensis]